MRGLLRVALVHKSIGGRWLWPRGGGAYRTAPSFVGCLMPYKANEARRHKIPRARYKVTDWPDYDRALQQRGNLTVWVTPDALAAWHPPRTGERGRPRDYSDLAIETGHLLRLAFGRPWRQTEGLLRSITALLGLSVSVPDHTTFSRRSPGLVLAKTLAQAQANGPVHVVIDATGLKVYGAGEAGQGSARVASGIPARGLAGREAWRPRHANLAQTPSGRRSQHRRDPCVRADEQRGRRCFPGRPVA